MKSKNYPLQPFMLVIAILFFAAASFGQCEPQECPDPENNGEICPDTMPIAFINQLYSEVATIVVPMTDTTGVPLHHFTITALENLPTGLTWESNAPNNEFMAGNDYCILIEGTPTIADTFYLTLVLDIYINLFGQPLYVMTIEDSTSLYMLVADNTGLTENLASVEIQGNYPNPFSGFTTVRYATRQAGELTFEVYSLLGELLHTESVFAGRGENVILYDGSGLSAGTYFYVLRAGSTQTSRLMVRID